MESTNQKTFFLIKYFFLLEQRARRGKKKGRGEKEKESIPEGNHLMLYNHHISSNNLQKEPEFQEVTP